MRVDSNSPEGDAENLTVLTPLVSCVGERSDDLRADSDSTASQDDADNNDLDSMDVDSVKLGISRLNSCDGKPPDQEKRMRREIANSNERRRMQSINAGFQSLRALLPKRDGEKISKAAILQQTAEYVQKLMGEKSQLADLNAKYKTMLEGKPDSPSVLERPQQDIPPKKRKKYEILGESHSQHITTSVPESTLVLEPAKRETQPAPEVGRLRESLDSERRMRLILEDQLRSIELTRLQTLGRLLPATTLPDYISFGDGVSTFLPTGMPQLPRTTSGFVPPCTLPPFGALPGSAAGGKSLEVMLEAIRHLEGELEPDSTTPNNPPPPPFYRPMPIRPEIMAHQPDSGISSPVSDRIRQSA